MISYPSFVVTGAVPLMVVQVDPVIGMFTELHASPVKYHHAGLGY